MITHNFGQNSSIVTSFSRDELIGFHNQKNQHKFDHLAEINVFINIKMLGLDMSTDFEKLKILAKAY